MLAKYSKKWFEFKQTLVSFILQQSKKWVLKDDHWTLVKLELRKFKTEVS